MFKLSQKKNLNLKFQNIYALCLKIKNNNRNIPFSYYYHVAKFINKLELIGSPLSKIQRERERFDRSRSNRSSYDHSTESYGSDAGGDLRVRSHDGARPRDTNLRRLQIQLHPLLQRPLRHHPTPRSTPRCGRICRTRLPGHRRQVPLLRSYENSHLPLDFSFEKIEMGNAANQCLCLFRLCIRLLISYLRNEK